MDSQKYFRRSLRLTGYDYSSPGAYFITICTYQHAYILWDNTTDSENLSLAGKIVRNAWLELKNHYSNLRLDEFCIMPNHVHGIILLNDDNHPNTHGLSEIVRWIKTFSARRINASRQTPGVHVWQRNYYEHIIRNEKEWSQIRAYISVNAEKWKEDMFHDFMWRRVFPQIA